MLSSASRIIFGLLVVTGVACRSIEPIGTPPELDAQGVAQVELGHALFFDMDLSVDRTVACVSCHELDSGGAQARSVSLGVDNQEGRRNAPSVFNASFKFLQFWDGRESDFDRQALGPITALDEMGLAEDEMVARLQARPEVVAAFARAFALDSPPLSAANVGRALAAYQRRLAWPGRVDRFLEGDDSALTSQEQAGYDFFSGNCAFCHDGPGVGGQRFEKLGEQIAWPEERSADLGRQEVTGDSSDRLRFVVPSLRHVGDTAPYFHDGSVETLEEAVELMAKHQLGETLSEQRIEQVAAFLRALDGDIPHALLQPPNGY